MVTHTFLAILFAVFMLPGIAAVFIPFLPAVPYMFIMALLFEIFDRFHTLTLPKLGILFIFPIVAFIVDQSAGVIGSRRGGATAPIWYAVIGAFCGTLFLPPFGGILGLFLGILVGELTKRRGHDEALKAATAGVVGTFTGMLINCALAAVFIIVFLVFTL